MIQPRTNPTECPRQSLLADLVLGRLSEPLIEELLDHTSECSTCAAALETMDGISDGIISAVRNPEV